MLSEFSGRGLGTQRQPPESTKLSVGKIDIQTTTTTCNWYIQGFTIMPEKKVLPLSGVPSERASYYPLDSKLLLLPWAEQEEIC